MKKQSRIQQANAKKGNPQEVSSSRRTRRPRIRPESLRPKSVDQPVDVSHSCLKCGGFLILQTNVLMNQQELRCLNCGWQPQMGMRIIEENQEMRAIRELSSQCFRELSEQAIWMEWAEGKSEIQPESWP